MSPIIRQVASRRTFSIIARARQVARGFEPHPFERMPKTQVAAPADYTRLAKRVGGVAMIYFPWYAVVLGWPLAAEKMVGKHL